MNAIVYGALDDAVVTRWMRIPDDQVSWGPVMDGVCVPLLGETLEKNRWAHGICAVDPNGAQPQHLDYDPAVRHRVRLEK